MLRYLRSSFSSGSRWLQSWGAGWLPRPASAFSLLFLLGLLLSVTVAACSPSSNSAGTTAAPSTAAQVLRVGYQKSATALTLLKSQGKLEERLRPQNISVEWSEFAAGPQMLEALNVGSIDFAYTGETPPVLAQAAGAPLAYVAYEPLGGAAEAILVRKDSPIRTVADLKGKTVVLNKGSNVHYLLVKALEEAGLQYTDIKTAFLPPGDARPAFEQGQVDAWVIWDPFLVAAEQSIGAKILRDGQGLVANRGFFLSTQKFVSASPDVVKEVVAELQNVSGWAKSNSKQVAEFLSGQLGIDEAALEQAEKRRGYGVQPIDEDVAKGQQEIADAFYKLKLIPQPIQVADAVWHAS